MKLEEYLKEKKMSLTDFCKKINYHITHVCHVIKGRRKAGAKLIDAIEKETKGKVTEESLKNSEEQG